MQCPHCTHALTADEARLIHDAYRAALTHGGRREGAGAKRREDLARCGCNMMSLKRAQARGKSDRHHLPTCEFYPTP
jgi:hypothetical protein